VCVFRAIGLRLVSGMSLNSGGWTSTHVHAEARWRQDDEVCGTLIGFW
jgi:hypothetical protein